MRRSIPIRLLSCLLTAVLLFTTFSVAANAEGSSGRYLKDVFIAYGENKTKAENWLRENGWEPFEDLNEGKTSNAPGFSNAVAMMGIKRTDDPKEAITDMATMNMSGGYSFDDYEGMVKQKKADISEFINSYISAIKEYRDNYNGKGSAGGKKRAQMAHDLLNKFYDGDPEGDYAVNDTGKPLGDLLLNKTKDEIGDDAYNALSAEEKLNTADFRQIILESSGPAVLIVEQALALATDTAEDSWLDRLNGLTGEELLDRITEFAPEAEGQDLAPSAAMNLLASHFEDYSKKLASEWINIHEDILWYEQYCKEHDLFKGANEDVEVYTEKLANFFNTLKEEDEARYKEQFLHFDRVNVYYYAIKDVAYSGEWGETLYDFFRPKDEEADYSQEYDYFAPLAAALSTGQRAALEFLSLSSLLKIGMNSDAVSAADIPSVNEIFKGSDGKKKDSISIYSGINRAIFRKGVALTSDALMQKNMGHNPYIFWEDTGIASIVSYTLMGLGVVSITVGVSMAIYGPKGYNHYRALYDAIKDTMEGTQGTAQEALLVNYENKMKFMDSLGGHGRFLVGLGVSMIIIAIGLKGAQIHKYYNRTFTKIPIMIVDEADIVTYSTDDKGNQVKKINFDQFAYYEVVKCNRQEIGVSSDAQDGVDQYKEWGCGSAADINADVGKQWLAMYVNRSSAKGNPILADSLKLQKGEKGSKMPSDCNGCLHMFTFENPVKIDDMNYSFRGDKNGMYMFWKGDENALSATAASFSGGTLALAGVGGLALGILCTTLIMLPKLRKKKKEEAA